MERMICIVISSMRVIALRLVQYLDIPLRLDLLQL